MEKAKRHILSTSRDLCAIYYTKWWNRVAKFVSGPQYMQQARSRYVLGKQTS
jgi:hypothetical protein